MDSKCILPDNASKTEILFAVKSLIQLDEYDVDDKYTEKPIDYTSDANSITINWQSRHESSRLKMYNYEDDKSSLITDLNNCIEDIVL